MKSRPHPITRTHIVLCRTPKFHHVPEAMTHLKTPNKGKKGAAGTSVHAYNPSHLEEGSEGRIVSNSRPISSDFLVTNFYILN